MLALKPNFVYLAALLVVLGSIDSSQAAPIPDQARWSLAHKDISHNRKPSAFAAYVLDAKNSIQRSLPLKRYSQSDQQGHSLMVRLVI